MVIIPLPSFSVSAIPPISGIKKFAPLTPRSASTNFSLNKFLTKTVNSSGVEFKSVLNFSLKSWAISSFDLCIAGVTI